MSEEFVGNHEFKDEDGKVVGSFIVFRVLDSWYWQSRPISQYQPMGPYQTSEAAYRGALGDISSITPPAQR